MIDWTTLISAGIAATPPTIIGILNHRNLRVPSGGTIGQKVEQAHDLAAVASAGIKISHRNQAALKRSVDRLNGDPNGTFHADDEIEEQQ